MRKRLVPSLACGETNEVVVTDPQIAGVPA